MSEGTADDSRYRELAPLLAMIRALPTPALGELGRALHAKLFAPPTPADRRVKLLGLLVRVLETQPQYPERLPYIARSAYDRARAGNPALGPPSARLQEQFGSWGRACHAAWGLLEDGRSWGRGEPWPRPARHPKNYTVNEVVASVRACAKVLGHIPSSSEFHTWVINRRARARQAGESTRPYAPYASVMRLLAPDRRGGNGWRLAVQRVFGGDEIPRRPPAAPVGDRGASVD